MIDNSDEAPSGGEQFYSRVGIVLKPPVSAEDLKTDTEYDPAGAEEFVALIRALRTTNAPPVSLR